MGRDFDRALEAAFISKLAAEVGRGGWWADVLADEKLIIAFRGTYLNVYWRGQSLFRVESVSSGLKVTTHEKYLVDPELASQVQLIDGICFDISSLTEKGFIRRYEGPEKTIAKLKSAAGLFSGLEKTGCHEIAVRNHGVIDCEIAFPGMGRAPRVDLASLEAYGDEAILVFWEAKHYKNGDLRADSGAPPVCEQISGYNKLLLENREAIERSYTKVAENFVAMKEMGLQRKLSPLITGVGTRKRTLTLEPKVGLIIFGFDSAQRVHAGWKGHLSRLKEQIAHVCAAGDAKNLTLKLALRQ